MMTLRGRAPWARMTWGAALWLAGALVGCDDGGGGGQPSADAGLTDGGGADADPNCGPGTEGCRCLGDDTCRLPTLTCFEGTCQDLTGPCDRSTTRCPPEDPVCYTPCVADRVDPDGTVRVCAPNGLMRGCLPGASCIQGSCSEVAAPNAQVADPGVCTGDPDCPSFQVCLQGRCYSECTSDQACEGIIGNERRCELQVCREICNSDLPCTDRGTICDQGLCLPIVPPDPVPTDPPTGAFEVSASALRFTATLPASVLKLSNVGTSALTLTVRKAEQTSIGADGRPVTLTDGALPWITLNGERGDLVVEIAAGDVAEIEIAGAEAQAFSRWTGRLEISGPGLPTQATRLVYSTGLRGRWSGKAYVFGNFDGEDEIEAWRGDRTNAEPDVPNAFMRAWANYRNGGINAAEMSAIIQATLTGSWDQPRVRELCRAATNDNATVCAPFNNPDGVIRYTADADASPVPSGVIEATFAMEVTTLECEDGHCATGRIDSAFALQYPGDPGVRLAFGGEPDACEREDPVLGCVTTLDALDAEIIIGARLEGSRNCPAGLAPFDRPWLVAGLPPPRGGDLLRGCRDTRAPFEDSAANEAFAEANPIPDGKVRRRRLELIDGLLIEQNVMSLIVRETIDPFQGGGEPLVNYQYITLVREPADPEDINPTPAPAPAVDDRAHDLSPVCSASVVETATGQGNVIDLSDAQRNQLALAVTSGGAGAATPLPAGEVVHSLCVWNEQTAVVDNNGALIDPNADDGLNGFVVREVINAGPDGNRPCFPGAEVIYFTMDAAAEPAAWDCNATFQQEACLEALQQAVARGEVRRIAADDVDKFDSVADGVDTNLLVRCADNADVCEVVGFDPTANRTFGIAGIGQAVYPPLGQAVSKAFRYKTQFVSRAGTTLGFAPTVCRYVGAPDPYCFDPVAIETVRERVDCAMALVDDPALTPATRATVVAALQRNFGRLLAGAGEADPILAFGFERLYAELVIMQGDEALTRAYTTRYAVGGVSPEAFEGSQFEPGGDDLSGIAGTEMTQLYRAAQSYELALSRFYRLAPTLWRNVTVGRNAEVYVSEQTVTTWLETVIRASTQRARVYSEIARRYQTFNQRDLAITVSRRAYARAHQESLILTALINAIADRVVEQARPQVRQAVAQAQVRYRVALLEMADRHAQVSSDTDFFGVPPGFVPFPALDEADVNGFEIMLGRATDRLELAAQDEARAIGERREFDNDEAAFRNELVTQRNSYEKALGAICGTFQGDDGRIYPAIPRYADRLPETVEGDPCGQLGNGEYYLQAGDIQGAELMVTRVRQEAANALAAMQDAELQVAQQCGLIAQDVGVFLQAQGVIDAIEGGIDGMNFTISILDKLLDFTTEFTSRINDVADEPNPFTAVFKAATNATWGVAAGVHFAATTTLEATILTSQAEIRRKARDYEAYTIGRECAYLQLEQVYALREMEREFLLTKLDALNAIWEVDVQVSKLRALANERLRLEAEWADATQLSIDASSAQADPTKRIYKNDAVRNAEQSFDVALRAAWQATLTYEYYTGSSYPDREALFLARLVDRGDINLRRYIEDLREAFFDFEQQFGNPDTRVARISLCNDIFNIPRLGDNSRILSEGERVGLCRERLKDPSNLDPTGALRLPFSTDFGGLSPLTVNHKILFVEVGLHGDLGGDGVARVYLQQQGTGLVSGTDGDRRFYTFPPRTAVMNPFFNGDDGRAFSADGIIAGPTRSIYRSYRFRERPFVQSAWALVLDQRSEAVNRDIDLGAIDDIVIDIYYTDFTQDSL